MKTMKTSVTFAQNILKAVLFLAVISFSSAASAGNGTPVKATAFTATINTTNNSRVDLKWSTEKENNLSHFIVERSTDGVSFSNAALVFAYGNTTEKSNYVFADNISKVQTATVYYRISSIGADGNNLYSDVQVISLSK